MKTKKQKCNDYKMLGKIFQVRIHSRIDIDLKLSEITAKIEKKNGKSMST